MKFSQSQMNSLKQRRIELVKDIIHKDSVNYKLLSIQPFLADITANMRKYPNEFLETLYHQIEEMGDYHIETMKDNPTWGIKYIQFCNDYIDRYNNYSQKVQKQQQQLQQQYQELFAANYTQQQQCYQQHYAQYHQSQQQAGQQQQQQRPPYYQKRENQYFNQQQQQSYQQRNYQHKNQNCNKERQQQKPHDPTIQKDQK